MTVKQRAVVAMRDAGLSYRQIATLLGVSHHAAFRLAQRASHHTNGVPVRS